MGRCEKGGEDWEIEEGRESHVCSVASAHTQPASAHTSLHLFAAVSDYNTQLSVVTRQQLCAQ